MKCCGECKHWVKNDPEYNLDCWQKRDFAPCILQWEAMAKISEELGGNGWAIINFPTATTPCMFKAHNMCSSIPTPEEIKNKFPN